MNRCWPGKEDGVITEKMCYNIFRILKGCGGVIARGELPAGITKD